MSRKIYKKHLPFEKTGGVFCLKINVLKLIFCVYSGSESFALERVIKEFSAGVCSTDNSEFVADHLCAVAFECGCMFA